MPFMRKMVHRLRNESSGERQVHGASRLSHRTEKIRHTVHLQGLSAFPDLLDLST